MLRDVFYYGEKPNVHPRERFAKNLADARYQSTTQDFWIINEFCDYTNFEWDFDFDFLPDEDVWAENHNNVWPSQHCKDSGTWLCSKKESNLIVYRTDVDQVKRKNEKNYNWKIYCDINELVFDFSWYPDPTDPPYIYVWGNQWVSGLYKPTVEYVVPGATKKKYMDRIAFVTPEKDRWNIIENILTDSFDFTWRPDPREPALIYVFGNNQYDAVHMPTIEYRMPGATEKKYIIDKKLVAKLAPNSNRFEHLENSYLLDYSWIPDPKSPPYIYAFGNQWNKPEDKVSIQYVVEGATEYKYMDVRAIRKPCMDKWIIPDNIDITGFDFSWEPSPADPPFIYEFGTQWQKTGGPRYVVDGATEVKYVSTFSVKALPVKDNWTLPSNLDLSDFDFSWHPDRTNPPYIYYFPTQWALTGGPIYTVPGAVEKKYLDEPIAKAVVNMEHWEIPDNIDKDSFDFSWHPVIEDRPYIYQFGTQHQKTGGPRYHTPGSDEMSPIKYIDRRILKSKTLPVRENFIIEDGVKVKDFDFSWHPDDTEQPYIYIFGNDKYPAEIMHTIRFEVEGAKQVKYISGITAILDQNKDHWIIPNNVDDNNFDYSWVPNPKDPPYNYEFGTQHQKTGGPKFIVKDAVDTTYISTQKVLALRCYDNWQIPDNIDKDSFDFSWHPDNTEKPYIYEFGTQWQKTDGPKYVVEYATEIKYIETIKAKRLQDKTNWIIPNNIDDTFDYSWHPDSTEPAYTYEFATIHNNRGGPIYKCKNSIEFKYIDNIKAKLLPDAKNWIIPENIDITNFDFSWVPHPNDPPYIYEFGTQWQKTGGPQYIVDGASEKKYLDIRYKRLPVKSDQWQTVEGLKIKDFDYSWHPDDTEEPYIYVFGNTLYAAEVMPTIKYIVKGATKIKYINDTKAVLDINMTNWKIPVNVDTTDFDFSWIPNPKDPPYIYEFGTQWQKTGGPQYIVEDATKKKYVNSIKVKVLPTVGKHWKTLNEVAYFDYSWHPDATEEPYIYVFGNQWYDGVKMPTVEYHVKGAKVRKYLSDVKAILKPQRERFKENIKVADDGFDFSWVPDPDEEPYVYIFGNQWNNAEIEPTLEYKVKNAKDIKYVDIKAKVAMDMSKFKILYPVSDFDFSWRPNPKDPAYIYVFGNQWYDAVKDPTLEYHVEGATDKKYITDIKAKVLPDMTNWQIPEGCNVSNFDFSWRPDPDSPKYIYQFGTLSNDEDGPRYITSNNNGEIVRLMRIETKSETQQVNKYYINTTLEDLVYEHPDEIFWALNKDIDYSSFDFNWRPNIEQARYIHAFGTKDNINTQTYFVSATMFMQGYKELNYVETKNNLRIMLDMFFVDKGNTEANDRFNKLKEKFGNKIQKTRYLNSWVDTINRCINRSTTNLCWILNSELDYSNFNFNYYPDPWQMKMVHIFGTQWSHWGTTFMVNRDTFSEDTKYIKVVEHLSNLNFVKDKRAFATNNLYDIYIIDHGNKECERVVDVITNMACGKTVKVIRYEQTYLQTLKNIINDIMPKKEHYVWVCSSICNYNAFDLSYICDPFAKENLHVFPSDHQKFGDTFLIDINHAKSIINELDILQQYNKVNYNGTIRTSRLPAPVIKVNTDTHVGSIHTEFDFPYAIYTTEDFSTIDNEPMNLWQSDTKELLVTSTGASRIIVPKEAKDYIKKELYDYPFIKTASKLLASKPLDIVYLSNGEKCAEENYEHLLAVTKGLKNRVVRVDGINGRVEAYHASAKNSETSWAFTVFAKLKVDTKFDWGWQPDRLQVPKHYIFHAKNPVNGLKYGHQGMIAYNKQLVLNNFGDGLDFTLDDPHETVEVLSGVATFNTDPYSTWRTAFREVIKLKSDYTDIALERLNVWLTKAKGKFAKDCLSGANDAVEYYNEVYGDIDKLKLSYEWSWLKDYYNRKYK